MSPITVPRAALQFEIGLPQIARADDGSVEATTISVPVLALRYGISERIELRAASPLYNRIEIVEASSEVNEVGRGDLELGIKWHALAADKKGLDVSIVGSVVLPVGEEPFTLADDRTEFSLNGGCGWPLGSGTTLTTIAGAAWTPVGEDDYATNGNLIGWLGRPLAERLSGYVETGWFPSDQDTAPVLAGGGLAFLVTPVLQLDTFFDRGLNDDTTDWIFGVGVSARL